MIKGDDFFTNSGNEQFPLTALTTDEVKMMNTFKTLTKEPYYFDIYLFLWTHSDLPDCILNFSLS